MRIYGLANGYTPEDADEDAEGPSIVVDLKVVTNDDVDPHEAMQKVVESAQELINAIHQQSGCARMSDDERAAALSALFLNPPHMEGN